MRDHRRRTPGRTFVLAAMLPAMLIAAPMLRAESGPPRAQAVSPLERFTPEQRKLLQAGESVYIPVITESPAGGEPKFTASAYILINAPVEKCYAMFLEFDKQYLYMPKIKTSKILSRSGNRVVIYKELDYPILDLKYTHILTSDPQAHRVDFITDPKGENSIKLSAGSFQFDRIDDHRSLFTYRMTKIDPGIDAPRVLVEYMIKRDLPQVTVNIKMYIESDGKWRK